MIRALAPALLVALFLVSCGGISRAGPELEQASSTVASTPGRATPSAVPMRPVPTPTPDPLQPVPPPGFLPETWIDGLDEHPGGEPMLIACEDVDGDGRITGGDEPRYAGLDIPIAEPGTCAYRDFRRDFYVPDSARSCREGEARLLVAVVGGGGTDLIAPESGVSLGLLNPLNRVLREMEAVGVRALPLLASSAVFGADMPQTRMEQWLTHHLRLHLEAAPCLTVAMIGHSHGGVIVTTVLAALEPAYAERLYGVLLDRSAALYDRPASEMPLRARILNIFQLREGWHGVPIEQGNVENVDASTSVAPEEPRLPDQPLVPVTHVNLDDAVDVQDLTVRWIVEAVR